MEKKKTLNYIYHPTCVGLFHLGRVKRRSAFEHVQNAHPAGTQR